MKRGATLVWSSDLSTSTTEDELLIDISVTQCLLQRYDLTPFTEARSRNERAASCESKKCSKKTPILKVQNVEHESNTCISRRTSRAISS